MLRINRQTDYAIRVVLALAKKPQGTRIPTSEIQREMLIPPSLLQRIVAELASGGFVSTLAGRDGGITLAHHPSEITLLQVVEAFEGPIILSDCVEDRSSCPFGPTCPVNRRWERLKNLIREELARTSFEELANDVITTDEKVPNVSLETSNILEVVN